MRMTAPGREVPAARTGTGLRLKIKPQRRSQGLGDAKHPLTWTKMAAQLRARRLRIKKAR
jgi:hypothetical protein